MKELPLRGLNLSLRLAAGNGFVVVMLVLADLVASRSATCMPIGLRHDWPSTERANAAVWPPCATFEGRGMRLAHFHALSVKLAFPSLKYLSVFSDSSYGDRAQRPRAPLARPSELILYRSDQCLPCWEGHILRRGFVETAPESGGFFNPGTRSYRRRAVTSWEVRSPASWATARSKTPMWVYDDEGGGWRAVDLGC